MQLENSFVVPVPVDEAWRILLDVERVAPCMPGAELESVDGSDFTGRVKVKVGPITITYRGKASFVSRDDDAHEAVLEASGKETRGAGTAKATVRTKLVDRGTETEVQVTTDLAVTGKPAQFGRGVLAEVSGKLIDQFANCLADEVRGGGAVPAASDTAPTGGMPSSETSPEAAAGSVPTSAPVVGAEADGHPVGDGVAAAAPAPAAPPLPPTGAPQEAAPAPAIPLATAAPGSAPPQPSAPPAASPGTGERRVAEPINLLETAGAPVAKRVLPVVAVLLVGYVVLRVIRRR